MWPRTLRLGKSLRAVAGLCDDLDVLLALKDDPNRLAEERMLVRKEDAERSACAYDRSPPWARSAVPRGLRLGEEGRLHTRPMTYGDYAERTKSA